MIDEHNHDSTDAWTRVRTVPPLETDAVHVWRVRVAGPPEGATGLSPEEQARAARLDGTARARFLTARAALRNRLAAYGACAPADLDFSYGPTGKPTLRQPLDLHFSVAHSADLVLLAFARSASVGVDLEAVRPVRRQTRIARRVLADASATALARLPAPERDDAFIWAWTQREAYVKAIGGGVLRSADPLPFVWPPRRFESDGWMIAPLAAALRHRACLAVAATDRRVRLLEYDDAGSI